MHATETYYQRKIEALEQALAEARESASTGPKNGGGVA